MNEINTKKKFFFSNKTELSFRKEDLES